MEPTIKELNVTKTLLNPITVNGKEVTEVTINKLILRPVIKRIVFLTEEFNRTIVFDGEVEFEAHKGDSDDTLISAFLTKIDTDFK